MSRYIVTDAPVCIRPSQMLSQVTDLKVRVLHKGKSTDPNGEYKQVQVEYPYWVTKSQLLNPTFSLDHSDTECLDFVALTIMSMVGRRYVKFNVQEN